MSIQAGIWHFDGEPADRLSLEGYSQRLAPFGPDGESMHRSGPLGMLYRPYHRTSDSRRERQPHISSAGNVITWDGRLDNRDDLAAQLADHAGSMTTDVAVVAAAFDRWGPGCFAKFIGDWAFAGWDPKSRKLTLAIDYMAIKHLYYYLRSYSIVWCSDLEALVLQSGGPFEVDEEYMAGYLAYSPVPGRTPYDKIRSVEPGHFLEVCGCQTVSRCYFRFDPETRIRYKTDAGYEDHFRHVFRQAVRRRLRSDAPILADLSGGLDSSSIVCVADDIMAREGAEAPSLDTYSHYDLGEPDGDDLRYLSIVERKRGRTGHHVDIARFPNSLLPEPNTFSVVPGGLSGMEALEAERARIWNSGNYRVRLGGIGGDEMLGGVPDPRPELADLLVQLRLLTFVRRTTEWSLAKRRPWAHLAMQSAALLLPGALRARMTKEGKLAPWLDTGFATRFQLSLRQFGPLEHYGFRLPSRQWSAQTVVAMSRLMSSSPQGSSGREEARYPYLDQDLTAFLLAIPREQLIRPGERRSLMRRALAGLVPQEILLRRTKGTAARRPLLAVANDWHRLDQLLASSYVTEWGFVDAAGFRAALVAAKNGDAPQLVRLLQTLSLEFWLSDVVDRGLVRPPSFQAIAQQKPLVTINPGAGLERPAGRRQ